MTQTADDKGIDLTDNDDDDGPIIPIGPRYYGIPLVKDRIDTCGPGQWISTDVVDIMIKKLKAEYLGDHYIVFPISIENIIVDSYDSKKTSDKINIQRHFSSTYEMFGSPDTDLLEAILYPHYESGHFTMIVVWLKEKKVTSVDGYGNCNTPLCKKLLCFTIEQFNRYRGKNKQLKYTDYSRNIEAHPAMPRQPNNYDCGFYVLKACECIMRREPIMFTHDIIATLRVEVYEMLLKAYHDYTPEICN